MRKPSKLQNDPKRQAACSAVQAGRKRPGVPRRLASAKTLAWAKAQKRAALKLDCDVAEKLL